MELCDWGIPRKCSLAAEYLVLGICPEGHIRERKLCLEHAEVYVGFRIEADLTCHDPGGCRENIIMTETCTLENILPW